MKDTSMPIRSILSEFAIYAYACVVAAANWTVMQSAETVQLILPAGTEVQSVVILLDAVLRTACLTGSFFGAALSVCFWPVDHSDQITAMRMLSIKFVGSAIAGIALTPMTMRWLGWQLDADWVVGVSTVVAFVAVGVVPALAVPLRDWIISKFKGKLT